MLNSLIKKLASDCMMKNCLDEYIGVAGVLLSVIYYIIQFIYTKNHLMYLVFRYTQLF